MLVRISDAPVVFFLELVFIGIRRGIAPQPELLDELLALIIRLQSLEGVFLLLGDDVGHVFVQPFPVRRFQLFPELLLVFLLLSLGKRSGDGFPLGWLRRRIAWGSALRRCQQEQRRGQ